MASRDLSRAPSDHRRPALGLVLVFFAVLLSPILFDAVAQLR